MASRLSASLTLWRAGHPAFPLWSGDGAALRGGRWNSKGCRVVYASTHYSLSLLEILANLPAKQVPPGFVRACMEVPKGASMERVESKDAPGWRSPGSPEALRVGDEWLRAGESLLLFVPSAVVEGIEENVLINPAHPDFAKTRIEAPTRIQWDLRLFPPGAK